LPEILSSAASGPGYGRGRTACKTGRLQEDLFCGLSGTGGRPYVYPDDENASEKTGGDLPAAGGYRVCRECIGRWMESNPCTVQAAAFGNFGSGQDPER